MFTFVINKMCEIIKSGVKTEKGFKEVYLNNVAKKVHDYRGSYVSSWQVYNHLHKWRARCIKVSKLRDLSGAQSDEDTHTIIMDDEHKRGHVSVQTILTFPQFAG
jgi:phosphoribosylformimino-5-aminoimidazole carboxamide ribonucleotide (ProFAR) isomerase